MRKSSRSWRMIFAIVLVVILTIRGVIPVRAATTTIPVTAGSLDWILENDNETYGDWIAGFESGPGTAPAGTGSFHMRFNTAAARISYRSVKYKNVKLSSIQVLSYSTYTNLPGKAISFQFNYDPNIMDENDLSFGRLIYEPVLNGTVSAGTWQTWNMIKGGAGLWYATNNVNSDVDDNCKRASPCTWQAIITAWPNIGTRKDYNSYISFQGGTAMGMKGFHGNIDNLKVQIGWNLDIYNFEPSSVEFSMTSVRCTPNPVIYGSDTTCTATVTRGGGSNTPSGTVNWTTGGDGSFSPAASCTLAGSGASVTCSVTYTAGAVGTGSHLISAIYLGNAKFRESTGEKAIAVSSRGLTVSATASDKVYDSTRTATVTLSNDALPGDAVTQTYTSALFGSRNVGIGKTVNITGISIRGADAVNYNLLNTTASTTANITKASLTVTADDQGKVYGSPDPAFTFSYSAFQGSDGPGDIGTAPTCSVADPHTDVGIYPITCSGGADNNYDFSYVDGTLAVGAAQEISFYSGIEDGWILESTEFSGKGGVLNNGASTFPLGDNARDRQFRSILSFDTSTLPPDARIISVKLRITRQGVVGTNPFKTHGNIQVDIKSGFFYTKPALQLADFQAGASLRLVGRILNTPVSNVYSTSLSSTAFPFINTNGTTQFRLRFGRDDNNDLSADFLKFFSGNALTPANRPTLVIGYIVP